MKSSAVISPCGTYRYWLERRWADNGQPQVFVMLNPSTADATADDPTIRRCVNYAKREGASGLIVVNLFAFRATDPKELSLMTDLGIDIVGPQNAENLGMALLTAQLYRRRVICAWGANAHAVKPGAELVQRAKDFGVELACLGVSKAWAPKHPLYLNTTAPLLPYPHPMIDNRHL